MKRFAKQQRKLPSDTDTEVSPSLRIAMLDLLQQSEISRLVFLIDLESLVHQLMQLFR
jgi:hypothetical protein